MPGVRDRKANTGKSARVKQRIVRPRREPKLTAVLEWRPADDGGEDIPYLVADQIIDAVRRNVSIVEACKDADVEPSTYHRWLREGARVAKERAAMEARELAWRSLRRDDEAYWWFWREVERAKATAERRLVVALDAVATGDGLVSKVVTRKVRVVAGEDGEEEQLVEETTKTSDVLPNPQAAEWMLSRRYRERWGSTETLEVVNSGQVEVVHTHSVEGLMDHIAEIRERMFKPIDTTATDVVPLATNDVPEVGSG